MELSMGMSGDFEQAVRVQPSLTRPKTHDFFLGMLHVTSRLLTRPQCPVVLTADRDGQHQCAGRLHHLWRKELRQVTELNSDHRHSCVSPLIAVRSIAAHVHCLHRIGL